MTTAALISTLQCQLLFVEAQYGYCFVAQPWVTGATLSLSCHLRFFVKKHKSQKIAEIRRPVRLPLQQDLVMRCSNRRKFQQFIFTYNKRERTIILLLLKKSFLFFIILEVSVLHSKYENLGIENYSLKTYLTSTLLLP